MRESCLHISDMQLMRMKRSGTAMDECIPCSTHTLLNGDEDMGAKDAASSPLHAACLLIMHA